MIMKNWNYVLQMWIKPFLFFLVAMVLFQRTAYVLRDKTEAEVQAMFYREKENTLDILLLGPSTMDKSIFPMRLYERYGYTSYNLANSGQSLAINYWCLKEALKHQKPKLAVLDLAYLFMEDILAGQPVRLSQFTDNMPLSAEKIGCITELAEQKDWKKYLFPVSLYHSRWEELTEQDYKKISAVRKGASPSFSAWMGDAPPDQPLHILQKTEKSPVEKHVVSVRYIEKIIQLCKEHGCKLLFINLPSYAQGEVNHGNGEELQRMWNGFYDYAEKNNLDYVNFIHETDRIGICFEEDFYDWRHMNYNGGVKMTDYFGKYLAEHYHLPDRRRDPFYAGWKDDYESYMEWLREASVQASMQNED